MYANKFGNQHLTPCILSYLATTMTRQYPSLRDPDSSPESPTFVSVDKMYFCLVVLSQPGNMCYNHIAFYIVCLYDCSKVMA